MINPEALDQLTGTYVRQVREQHGLTRKAFTELCGFSSPSRLVQIETKESWKDGDRQKIMAVLVSLEQNKPVEEAATTVVVAPANGRVKDESLPDIIYAIEMTLGDWSEDGFEVAYLLSDAADVIQLPVIVPELPKPDLSALDAPPGTYFMTNSEFVAKLRCPRKWWLAFYRGLALKSKDYSGNRSVGDRIHRALACWYVPDGQTRIDPRVALQQIIQEDWLGLSAQSRERGFDDEQLGTLAQKFNESCELERIVIDGYMEWIEETGADSNYRVIAPELVQWWDTEIDVDDKNVPVRFLTKLDAQLERLTDGVKVVMDHKSTKELKSLQNSLHGNPQSLTYLLVQWLNTPAGESHCDAALWNMLKKVKRTERAKPPFYERAEIRYNETELESHKRELLAVTRGILWLRQELEAGADHHDVAPKNWTSNCSWDCSYVPICSMFDDGSRVENAVESLYQVVNPLERYTEELT